MPFRVPANAMAQTIDRHTDIVTYRLKRPRGQLSIKEKKKKFFFGGGGVVFGIGANIPSM